MQRFKLRNTGLKAFVEEFGPDGITARATLIESKGIFQLHLYYSGNNYVFRFRDNQVEEVLIEFERKIDKWEGLGLPYHWGNCWQLTRVLGLYLCRDNNMTNLK